ncbi:MAG TPA: FHA domain-containing protein, partial [Thermoanaerobaculia bacterium]|nr:FHA domain-containing protein [Thermoanaerobaculia bacterium]
ARCSSCHGREPHAATQAVTPPCVTCHAEHRGMAKLAAGADSRCASCHRDLASHVLAGVALRPAIAHVVAFGDEGHPQFTFPPDGDTLRFNHRLHLQAGGIFNGAGKREVLTCTNCHALVEVRGKADPKPLRFATDCQRCHKLTFDPRYAAAEVPHGGDPGLVYGFILATYAGRRDVTGKSPDELRRILTARTEATPDERAVLNAEQVIKTKCTLCHELRRVNGQLAATPPAIRTRWLEHARFTHGTHRNVGCETCHDAARKSAATRDVLMPSRNDCVTCHGAAPGRAATTCVTCHEYHERSRNLRTQIAPGFLRGTEEGGDASSGGGAGMLGTVLLCAIVLLLVVVLVPVGVALYQRLRVRPEPPRADVPTTPSILPPTMRIPALNLPPPQPPPAAPTPAPPPKAAPAPPPASAKTVSIDLTLVDRKASEPAEGGTEAVQWYGMIACTSGPLEGQRWVIEEEGLYIGRDGSMSQIVIPDGRVSKRHVRIVPRDGRAHAIDQGSTNGTFLGKPGGQRITDVQLKRGDVLVIADNVATFLYQI